MRGQLLFIVLINYICQNHKSNIQIYAHDCKLYRRINNIDDRLFQNDIDSNYQWFEENLLSLNASKYCQITYTLNNSATNFDHPIDNTQLNKCTHFKDLRIIFDKKLTFRSQINAIVVPTD